MPGWVIWAIIAVGLAIGEIFTPGLFFLGPVAVAAVVAAIVAAVGVSAAIQLIEKSGYQVVGSTPAELDAHVKREILRWAKVVKDAGVTAQ